MIRYPSNRPVSGSNAPSDSDDGLASSPANIERDHGVGYDARSISSIAFKSRSSSRLNSTRLSTIKPPLYQRPAASGTGAPLPPPGRNRVPEAHGTARAADDVRRCPAG